MRTWFTRGRWLALALVVLIGSALAADAQGRWWVLVNGTLRYVGAVTITGQLNPTNICLDDTNKDTCLARNAAGKLTLTGTTPMLQLGGTTSSFPALKQSGSNVLARLADDSADTVLLASQVQATGSVVTAGSGTGITVGTGGRLATHYYIVTVASTAFICNAVTCDVTIATLPIKTFVLNVVADLTTVYACASTCTTSTLSFTLGKTAGGNEYLLSVDADAATGRFGTTAATLGASLAPATAQTLIGDLGSWTATTAIVLRMTSGTGNIGTGAATNFSQGSVTFYLTTERML